MKVKAKLYKGPFSGKSYEVHGSDVVITGPKPMTRKQKYEWQVDNAQTYRLGADGFYQPMGIFPRLEARYQLMYLNGQPWQHPNGSYFFQYVEGSKREY